MKRLLILLLATSLVVTLTIGLPFVSQANFPFTVYDQDRPGWESAVVVYDEEFFTDAILNPGVSVVSTVGYVDTTNELWHDALECPAGTTSTIWQFATPIRGFGGNWDPGVPGGPGARIAVAVNGSWVSVGEISENYTGEFWGFVSTAPFSQVLLIAGSNCGSAVRETYELDNMVYAPYIAVEVGGEVYPVDKLNILAPWIALAAALIIGTTVAVRRRRAQS